MIPRPELDAGVKALIGYRAIAKARKAFLEATADLGFIQSCVARYAEGQAEYGYAYEWLDWGEEDFRAEVDQEIADVVIYTAMRMARRQLGVAGT